MMSALRKVIASTGIGASNLISWWARRASGGANVLEIDLSGQVVEEVHLSGIWQRILPASLVSMRDLLSAVSYAEEDKEIKALLVKVSSHDLGWGRAAELCEAIRRFRAAGKYAMAFLEEPENVDTMIAAACDRVVTPPGVPVYLTGLLSEVMYFKEILEKLDIKPELFQAGKYKSAVEPYVRSGMSKEHREAVEAVLDSIYGQWVKAMAAGRGLSEDQIKELIDQGPWLAEEAKEAGLVDDLIYPDEIDDYLEKWLGIAPRRIPLDRFHKLYAPRTKMADPWRKMQALALITAAGTIHAGESRYYGAGDSTVGANTIRRALIRVREDDCICAVVLRIDSPGGSAAHSDLIWREVERLRKEKPVVVSMADVAASGGYYIAMPADHIMASPSTLTGSIGVIGGKLNLKGLYQKIGISKEQVSRGKHADLATDYGPLSPELKKKLKAEMEAVYRIFVEKAARARKCDSREMDEAAQGRVWTGEQAKQMRLVDELGNLMTAIERAKERAGIHPSRRVPVFLPPRARRFSLPMIPFSLPIPSGIVKAAASMSQYETLADSPILALMPFLLKIK
jgi:protease-4